MNKTINVSRIGLMSVGILLTFVFLSLIGLQKAEAAIVNQLSVGSRGSDVTELQTYLATDSTIYPSGLVTGYFGSLTQAAVERFQIAQGIVSAGTPATTGFGRVGPTTMARLNSLMGQTSSDVRAPGMSNISIQTSRNNATLSWSTNEFVTGEVFYDTNSIQANEATGPNQKPYVSGTLATNYSGVNSSQSVTIQNLQPNTTYYYLVRSIDNSGNITMTLPYNFRTNN